MRRWMSVLLGLMLAMGLVGAPGQANDHPECDPTLAACVVTAKGSTIESGTLSLQPIDQNDGFGEVAHFVRTEQHPVTGEDVHVTVQCVRIGDLDGCPPGAVTDFFFVEGGIGFPAIDYDVYWMDVGVCYDFLVSGCNGGANVVPVATVLGIYIYPQLGH